jgi:hypothetical protein
LYRPDAWYLVKGEELIMLRYAIFSLQRDLREDTLKPGTLPERLRTIRDMLPEDPKEAPAPPA